MRVSFGRGRNHGRRGPGGKGRQCPGQPETNTNIITWIADKNNPKNAFFEMLPNKSGVVLLGTFLHFTGNSTRSMEHRLHKAENAFWKHYTKLKNKKANLEHKLNLWISTVLKSATYDCGSLYLDEKMIHKVRSWELRFLPLPPRSRC